MHEKKQRRMGVGRDIYGVNKNGNVFPVEAGLNPFTAYGKNFVMALIIDITIRKQQEKEILEFAIKELKEHQEKVNKLLDNN